MSTLMIFNYLNFLTHRTPFLDLYKAEEKPSIHGLGTAVLDYFSTKDRTPHYRLHNQWYIVKERLAVLKLFRLKIETLGTDTGLLTFNSANGITTIPPPTPSFTTTIIS